MKTSSCFFSPIALGVCLAAAAFFASNLHAQIARTNALAFATGDTNALRENVAALQTRVVGTVPRALAEVQSTNQLVKTAEGHGVLDARQVRALMLAEKAQATLEPPGGAWESLVVNNHLLNVNFADNTKAGFAAIGQTDNDYWNPYVMPYYSLGTLQNILWSDQSGSPVDITVANAPGQWGNGFCVDPMYASFIYPWDSGHITVTIADLPADTYDFYVYATRASDNGAPVIEFLRAGVSLWTKGTTLWGHGWYSTYWDEHEQYVRFRNIAVDNPSITLDIYPDAMGYASISGIQIVPSWAIPLEQPVITKLLNVDFAACSPPYKTGPAAVGLGANDFWNKDCHLWMQAVTLPDLKWSDQTVSPVAMTVRNGPGTWGNALPDPMFHSYMYSHDGGNITITLTDLPAGVCDVYLYGHTPTVDDNAVFELWSDEVNWGTKGTSLIGDGPTYATWEVGQQYVRFKDVTVTAGKPLIIHAKHTTYGYNNVSGMQIAYTGAADTDADGLPDGWERRCFGNLDQIANADTDGDGLTNLREYQLDTDPTRTDSNANGISDLYDFEKVWVEDGTPQGGYEMGDNEGWNWVSYWYDGDGWSGQAVYPHSGRTWDPLMHVSELVPGDMHQHYFWSSLPTMRPGVGDVLYAYVNLDSSYPPSEVMLQWYVVDENGSGSWEHRAYWGADLIAWGAGGTASRYPVGALPTAGQWVRLEVLASAVGLEGKIVEGMAFTLHGGRAAWDSAGTIKPDHDGDGLPDTWEMQYFGNLLQTATDDNDGDGLSNLYEYRLGYNPTDPYTGGSLVSDADKDFDGDLLSNLAEINHYGSDPANAHTFNPSITDAEYKATGRSDGASGVYLAGPYFPGGNQIQFILLGADEATAWDLYITPDFNPGYKWVRYYSGSPGQTVFTCPTPPGFMNFFRAGLASDFDSDGLTDGYEALVSKTVLNNRLTDGDILPDGWEVEFGLSPLLPETPDSPNQPHADGNYGNPDNDAVVNRDEFTGGSDPKKHNVNEQPRRIVSVTVPDPTASEEGDAATFLITRTGNLGTSLTVYYVLGGSATIGSDYGLNPTPSEQYPRYSITIPQGSASRELHIMPVADSLGEGPETVIIGIMPDPSDQYVVAAHPHRATATIRDRVCHTYEVNEDFLQGLLVGTETRTGDESGRVYLQPSSEAQFPYVNIACSYNRGTVVRINVNNGTIVGEYRTSPDNIYGNPSRTTVDQYGNVWVANRDDSLNGKGSITRIGLLIPGPQTTRWTKLPNGTYQQAANGQYFKAPFEYNTCLDRDGDGYIRTSRGLADILRWTNQRNGATAVDSMGGVSTAEDEAILEYVRVEGSGTRTIAVDKFNDIWVGGTGSGQHQKVDGLLAQVLPETVFSPGCGGYGGLIDANGVLWSARGSDYSLLRFVPPAVLPPSSSDWQCLGAEHGNYGLGIDPQTGKIWHTDYDYGTVYTWNPDGTPVAGPYATGGASPRGVVVDNNGDVWIANSGGNSVGHLRTDGTFIGTVDLIWNGTYGFTPTGVAVDADGKIWVTCLDSYNAMRIDPDAGPTINGHKLGAVEVAVDLGDGSGHQPPYNYAALPYNYSDMTGFNNQIVNPGGCPLKGYWTVVEDGHWPSAIWSTASWTGNTPTGTSIEVWVRSDDDRTALSTKQFVQVNNGVPLTAIRGRYLEVRVSLTRDACEKDPYLENLTICRQSPTLTLIYPPQDQSVEEGQDTELQVVAIGAEPITYQWFRNGQEILGLNSPVVQISAADCLDAGEYTVHITDAFEDELDAGSAFLTVYPRPISIPLAGKASRYPAEITVSGAPETVSYVMVALYDFNHSRPDDVDILLVSPTGKKIILMSDAGSTTPVSHANLFFAYVYGAPPDESPIPSNQDSYFGDWNYGEQETSFPLASGGDPDPPNGPYTDTLADLNGVNPNGVWRLYIVDDTNDRAGFIAGSWCLILQP